MPDLKQAALDYQARGFRVIPCQPKGKVPLVEWRAYQVTAPTCLEVGGWWDTWPDANVALVLGQGTFAVDVDGPIRHREIQPREIRIPPRTPTSMTGKGVHSLFNGDQPARAGLLPQADTRGRAIIVVP